MSNRGRFNAWHPDRLPPAMLVASLEAFNNVFGSRCAQATQRLLGETEGASMLAWRGAGRIPAPTVSTTAWDQPARATQQAKQT